MAGAVADVSLSTGGSAGFGVPAGFGAGGAACGLGLAVAAGFFRGAAFLRWASAEGATSITAASRVAIQGVARGMFVHESIVIESLASVFRCTTLRDARARVTRGDRA